MKKVVEQSDILARISALPQTLVKKERKEGKKEVNGYNWGLI